VTPGLPSLLANWQPRSAWVPGPACRRGSGDPFANLRSASGRCPRSSCRPRLVRACPGPAPAGSLAHLALKPLVPLGQFRSTFIIAVDDDGVAIIDQHVAHERVLYERIMARLTAGNLESQGC